jgi:hypothetical protein
MWALWHMTDHFAQDTTTSQVRDTSAPRQRGRDQESS